MEQERSRRLRTDPNPLTSKWYATGENEDFLTGFSIDNKRVWGRQAGVGIGLDGSLFVTDDASNSIWRVKYVGH
jgi:glucose/arabinose dehydrogenase